MMKITITMEVLDEFSDPAHWSGVTDDGYRDLVIALSPYGEDIDVKRSSDD